MKTKEIEVWGYEGSLLIHDKFPSNFNDMPNVYKAKLIIELPERKVEITESEFDEAVKDYDLHNPCLKAFSGAMEHIKQKLFGDKHE